MLGAEEEAVLRVGHSWALLSDFLSSNPDPLITGRRILISSQHSGAMVSSTRTKGR